MALSRLAGMTTCGNDGMDVRTLLLALLLTTFSITILFLAVSLFRRRASARLFTAAFFSICVATTVQLLPVGDKIPGIILANLVFFLFYLFMTAGFRSLFSLPAWPWRNWLYATVFLGVLVYEYGIAKTMEFRIPFFNWMAILVIADMAGAVRKMCKVSSILVRSLTWAVIGQSLLTNLVRLLILAKLDLPHHSVMAANPETSFTILSLLFNQGLWATGILVIEWSQMEEKLSAQYKVMESLAVKDPLTGLLNRNYLDRDLDLLIESTDRYNSPLSMILIDLDHFKKVNDRFGHDIGDQVLVSVVHSITSAVRSSDKIFRWGGEELLIVLPNTDLENAGVVAEKVRQAVAGQPHPEVGQVTISLGVAEHFQRESKDLWFKRADLSLLRAKQGGRNRTVLWKREAQLPVALVRLEWQDKWSSGNEQIDQEHQELLALGNQLLDLTLSEGHQADILQLYDQLALHVVNHFRHEEAILAALGYPELDPHRSSHQSLMELTAQTRQQIESGQASLAEVFNFVMGKIVLGHLLAFDVKFFPTTLAGSSKDGHFVKFPDSIKGT